MKTAVLGFGTVGAGIHEMLKTAEGLEPGPVWVRRGKADEAWKTDDFDRILADDSVAAVAEAIGGTDPAFALAKRVLESGRHFVTANKALVADCGIELQEAADRSGAAFLFSAACGGGVPLLHNLALARRSDEILSVEGILNGTTNYMLNRMQHSGLDYGKALKEAQILGYAEADPFADVSGLDALRKIRLAAAVAFGILPDGGLNEGIEDVTAEDVRFYRSKGLVLRLIAGTEKTADGASALVQPVLFPESAPEAAVSANGNLASYEGRRCGRISFSGQGAGRFPTASAVIRDLLSIKDGARRMFPEGTARGKAADGRPSRYLVRLPEAFAGYFPGAEEAAGDEDGSLRLITESVSPGEMFRRAERIRKAGGGLAFAALAEDRIC